ncbi:MAG: hypothetical protein ACYDBJ_16195 [Aggregatilineales bacterium]
MPNRSHHAQSLVLVVAVLIAVAVTLILSVSLLPPAPLAPTPTWPQGIDLPNKLPHLP